MNIEKFNETKRNTAFKLKIYSPFILRDKFSIKLLHKFLGDWEGHTKKSDTIINPITYISRIFVRNKTLWNCLTFIYLR